MKKLILVAVLLIGVTMQAQFLKIGAKVGANFANINSNTKIDDIIRYHVGLVAEMKLLENFSVQPELLYSTQGVTYKNALTEFRNELGYLSIPVLAKFYLTKNFSFEVGPQFSFLLSQKNSFDIKDAKTFDFAIAVGLGYKITKNIFVQGRYGFGLTEMSKDAKAKSSVFQLSLGVIF